MAKCPRCSTRKAKRSCPALSQTICPNCCAESRMIELACPEKCPYLQDARRSTIDRWVPKFVQYLMAVEKSELLNIFAQFEPVIMLIERAMVSVQRHKFRDLSDEEARLGAENALKTYQTLDRGLIYEHTSESLRIQAITRAILDTIEDLNKQLQERHNTPLKTGILMNCLELVIERVRFEMESGQSSQVWLRQAALFCPYPEEETRSLIVTG